MTKINYSSNEFIEIVKKSNSFSTLLNNLGLRPAGGNFSTVKKWIYKLNIDISHWKVGSDWNKGLKLKDWSDYTTSARVKKHLIKHLGHKCEKCFISVWYDLPIMLEVHHIDGNRFNNSIENLQLLCPNCHSTTYNWRGKKNSSERSRTVTERGLGPLPLPIGLQSQKKIKVIKLRKVKKVKVKKERVILTKIDWPTKELLEQMIINQSVRSIAKQLGVCDHSIRNRCRKYEIDISKLSLWSQKHGDCSSKWRK
jgi:hypothetical protein